MSDVKENVVVNEDWKVDGDNWIWIFLLFMLFGGLEVLKIQEYPNLKRKSQGLKGRCL